MNIDTQTVAQAYLNLSNPNPQIRENANQILFQFQASPQAWAISKELLTTQTNETLQFLGAQVLYLKVKNEFPNLSGDEKNDMRQFIFETILENHDKISNNAFKQLSAGAAIIGLYMINNGWENFVPDLLNFTSNSQQKLFVVLDILINVNLEFKEVKIDSKSRDAIKDIMRKTSNQMTEVIYNAITNAEKNNAILVKALDCLKNLAMLRVIELVNYPNLIDLLLKSTNDLETASRAIEVITEGVKNSTYPDHLFMSSFAGSYVTMPDGVQISVNKIIEFLYGLKSSFQNLNSVSFCFQLSDLAAHLGVGFYVLVFENVDYCKALMEFVLACTSHKNRKVSSNTFEYWNFVQKEISSANQNNANFAFISEIYFEVFRIVTEKCRAKSLKIVPRDEAQTKRLYNAEKEETEHFEEDTEFNHLTQEDINLTDYRTLARHVLYSCYLLIKALKGTDGIGAIFQSMIPILNREYIVSQGLDLNNETRRNDYILACEAIIFASRCILDNTDEENPDQYAIEILKNIIYLPRESLLMRSSLYFIQAVADQLKFMAEYINQVFDFCLSCASDQKLIEPIAECFHNLANITTDHINIDTLEKIAKFMENSIFLIEDPAKNYKCITAVFKISKRITEEQVKIKFIQNAFHSVEEKFKAFSEGLSKNNISILQTPSVKSDALKLFVTFSNVLQGFQTESKDNPFNLTKVIEETALPFILRNISYICAYLTTFSQYEEFITRFASIIKTSIRICGPRLEQFYQQMIVSALSVFEVCPDKNFSLLDTIGTIIFYFEHSEEQQKWLQQNFSNFNHFIINLMSVEKNVNILSKWIDILKKVFELYRDFFLSLPELEQIIGLLLTIFCEIAEIGVLRKSAELLSLLIGTKSTIMLPAVLKFLPKILELTFAILPGFDPHKVVILTPIISGILTGIEDQDSLVTLFMNALKYEKYINIDEQEKSLFLECIYAYREDTRTLSVLLKYFIEYVQNPIQNLQGMNYIKEKLQHKRQ